MEAIGPVVAAAFCAAVRADGLEPDPALRLLTWAGARTSSPLPEIDGPDALGVLHERLLAAEDRRRRGAWYTPAWLAADLVGRAVDGRGPVADPACGGGVFLLAAAERLLPGRSPSAVVAELWGCDVEPLAVAVAEAGLWWWSARLGEPTVSDRLVVGDALTDTVIPPSAAVVGNPPFLGQLKRSTAAGEDRRRRLKERFGDVVRPYTDEAWLFLLAAVDATAPGGCTALVQPKSLLAARDAGAVRSAVDRMAELVDVWVDDGSAFDAGVHVCAPLLQRRAAPSTNDWSTALATALGHPSVDLRPHERLGDRADVIAGFRDEYYGLVDAVREGGVGPRLVTSGAVDPLDVREGVDVRFAKRRWRRPTVDVERVTGRARRWVDAQAGPKLLVATQTKVLEAAPDHDGSMIGSVPVVVVRPKDPGDLWHLAAALHAPAATAWLLRASAGTALSPDACKPTAALLADLPLPVDPAAWDEAARLAREIAGGADAWAAFAATADRAHGVTDGVTAAWWLARLPRPRSPRSSTSGVAPNQGVGSGD